MNAEHDETNLAAYKLTKPNKSQVYKLNISPTYKLTNSPTRKLINSENLINLQT